MLIDGGLLVKQYRNSYIQHSVHGPEIKNQVKQRRSISTKELNLLHDNDRQHRFRSVRHR